jgi:hypothetical protein
MVGKQTVAAHGHRAGQDRPAALKFENNQYGVVDPKAKIERRGCFKLPRRRTWRGRAHMVTSPQPQPGDLLCRATPHGAARQRCRAVAHGAAG